MTDTTTDNPNLHVEAGKDFPTPPAHLVDALDNSQPAAEASAPKTAVSFAALDYVDGPPEIVIPITRKFRLNGEVVETITVKSPTVVEVGEVIRRIGEKKVDVYDFYAAMTGLPADVIRALTGEDGDRVTDAGWSFLPRFVRGAMGG